MGNTNTAMDFAYTDYDFLKAGRTCCKYSLYTFYMGKPVGPRFGQWYSKFRTSKFRPGIAFTICTNQFHLPKNDREGLKLVSKIALKKSNTNFRLEYSVRKNRTTFSDVPLLPEIFR